MKYSEQIENNINGKIKNKLKLDFGGNNGT